MSGFRTHVALVLGLTVASGAAAPASATPSLGEVRIASEQTRQTWGACGISSSSSKTVATFVRYGVAKAYLWRGTERWGFRHIQAGHASQFATVAAGTNLAGNWRYMADYAIRNVPISPSASVYQGANKYCCSHQLALRDARTGNVIRRQTFRVVVDLVQRKILTAFPSRSAC
ncbi:hypothetical protein [Demequina gelatinilytica]|uniref:hypothetical protein n=1 Tax=Demequina gelatinilytica TaxID=1638980 RepID=UPI00078405C8|nr:hypothetical protein [Demequina gelatinilytica]